MPHLPASPALARFTVLDLTRVRAGPTCVRQLADWGADVIKVELPDQGPDSHGLGGPRAGSDFQNLHRNKRSLTLNLKAAEGRDILLRLVERADVVVENFRPDVKDRLRIAYDDLRAVNPRIVLASISGFGQDGPYAERPGFDQIAQGMGGLMSVTGAAGARAGPRRHPGRRPVRRPARGAGHPGRAARARELGRGPVGPDLAVAGAGVHAGFSGDALAGRPRGAQTGRQQSSDQHPDRRVRDHGRPHQHRRRGPGDLAALLPGDRPRGADPQSRLCASPPTARSHRDALNAELAAILRRALERALDRAAEPGGRAVRPDQHHRSGVRRPAGAPPRARPGRALARARRRRAGRAADHHEPDALAHPHAAAADGRAHR